MLALYNCDDSQLQVKNVEKNQTIAKSVKNPKISKLSIKICGNTDHLNKIITNNKMWIYCYDLTLKQQMSE